MLWQAVHTSIHLLILRCKMLVGDPQTPLICIFQCRLRIPAGRFLPGDALWVVQDLHEVGCRFCKRIVLHLFRNRRFQKRNPTPAYSPQSSFCACNAASLRTSGMVSARPERRLQALIFRCGLQSTAPWSSAHSKSGKANPATDLFHFGRSSSSSLHCGTSERTLCNCSYACCSAGVTFLQRYSRWMVRCQYNASLPCLPARLHPEYQLKCRTVVLSF